jgi:guanylate kinase
MGNILLNLSGVTAAGKSASTIGLTSMQPPAYQRLRSVTTRELRGPLDDKIKIGHEEFHSLRQSNGLFAAANVWGNDWYGVRKSDLVDMCAQGYVPITDVRADSVGTLREEVRDVATLIAVYIIPPSEEEWIRRLGLDERKDREARLAQGRVELNVMKSRNYEGFDLAVVNDDLATTVNSIHAFVHSRR